MSYVTFPVLPSYPAGVTYDDTTGPNGLDGGGHTLRFIPSLKAVVETAATVVVNAATATAAKDQTAALAAETVVNLGNVSGTQVLNMALGTVFKATATGNCAWTIINPRSYIVGITLVLTNGGVTGQTFPGTYFASGFVPNLTATGTDVIEFFSDDGWVTKTGFISARDRK
ncbi:MAG: hypothetical protein ACOYL3_16045 [Desulfuromonadaceae bacterium]